MTETTQEVDERLRTLRKEYGYTQQQIADYLGISQSSLVKYEKGTRNPPLTKLLQLTDLYNTTPEYILYNEQPPEDKPHFKANRHLPPKTMANMNKILSNLYEMQQIHDKQAQENKDKIEQNNKEPR